MVGHITAIHALLSALMDGKSSLDDVLALIP
jgi:hypothetical protein